MKLSQLESRFMTNADWPLLCLDKHNSDTGAEKLERDLLAIGKPYAVRIAAIVESGEDNSSSFFTPSQV
jgi:hypothetical protein